jgi:hypothetical protein
MTLVPQCIFNPAWSIPVTSQKLRHDRVEHVLPERPNELLGVGRANAADHARAEVFLDAFD